ncbi:C69 family dipeptidase, partial [Candidatus Bipolaricaulota bacterium]|nr:C69 family dipeptidase [Candidatus Bipolaricaulota bacterium]
MIIGSPCAPGTAYGCTNVLVDARATVDGSTYVTYSCDGGVFAAIGVELAAEHGEGAWIGLLEEPEWGSVAEPPTRSVIASIPQVANTYRYIDVLAGPMFSHVGGTNEHGVCIAETTLVGARPELANDLGWLAPFSVQAERSLMTLALQRARTAREAVLLIGDLAETYGYHSPFPVDGEQLAIGDADEVWSMEIFGPGPDWFP